MVNLVVIDTKPFYPKVLEMAQKELCDYEHTGVSVMGNPTTDDK